jgi:hypothetical protein
MNRYSVTHSPALTSIDSIKVDWHHESSRLFCDAPTLKRVKTCAFAAMSLTLAVTFLVFFVDVLASLGEKSI